MSRKKKAPQLSDRALAQELRLEVIYSLYEAGLLNLAAYWRLGGDRVGRVNRHLEFAIYETLQAVRRDCGTTN